MQKQEKLKTIRKPQSQARPGQQHRMMPQPKTEFSSNEKGKLFGKTALITGGDSGIGRAVAVLFAREGATVAISYLNEHVDAQETKRLVDEHTHCLLLPADLTKERNCKAIVSKTVREFGRLDIVVNNAALHYESKTLDDISTKQWINTFNTNVLPYFWVTQAALPHLKKGGCIINTSSVTAYRGSDTLIDYASSKGAIVSFTRSLASNLAKKGIRVNGVAPGPIWTPLIASSFKPSKIAAFGSDVPMARAGEPAEIAPSYLFLACSDSSYMTGQFLHPNGGEIING
jgi:NAD(P)-dependent dehydrogenase (short-subunit alcohol dehydrogenase family)